MSGKQRGVDDDRYIWPEMLRIIEESGPSWVVIENSDNVLRMAFGQIATDLETAGYQVGEPLIIPACAVNADHRRNRAWICAHADKIGLQGGGEKQIQGIASLPGILAGVLETDRSRQSISEPRMLRGYNGLPGWMDRIKALGNAVVPQIPEIIGRAIIHVSQEQP